MVQRWPMTQNGCPNVDRISSSPTAIFIMGVGFLFVTCSTRL